MTSADAERQIAERRDDDRGFFRVRRLWDAIVRDRTRQGEAILALFGFLLNGVLIELKLTTFPPMDVEFFLRSWGLSDDTMGLSFILIAALHLLGVCTYAHRLRAAVAFVGFALTLSITLAYVVADLPTYFQAWAMYLGIAGAELYLMIRNLGDHDRVEDAKRLVAGALRERAGS